MNENEIREGVMRSKVNYFLIFDTDFLKFSVLLCSDFRLPIIRAQIYCPLIFGLMGIHT